MIPCVRFSAVLWLISLFFLVPDDATGGGVPIRPGVPVTVTKVPAADCRVVRGFYGVPVDGSVRSRDYRGEVAEHPDKASDGVHYSFNGNDGVHITLRDGGGFDTVVLRGGASPRMYVGEASLTEPKAKPAATFRGIGETETVRFARPVKNAKASFFGLERGRIAEVSFYRTGTGAESGGGAETWTPGSGTIRLPEPESKYAPENVALALRERYPEDAGIPLPLAPGVGNGGDVRVEAGRPVHFITEPFTARRGLSSVSLDFTVRGSSGSLPFVAAVQDPLDPRLDLAWVEFEGSGAGRFRFTLDIPDQVFLPGTRLWLTLRFGTAAVLSGPEGGAPRVGLRFVSPEDALSEAVERRKFLLKTFFSLMSEPRPWTYYRLNQPRDEFYATNRYSAQCPELFMTIDQCHALAPGDDMIRQYREWVFGRNLPDMPAVAAPPAPPAGVPAWAWYPRQAWLEIRRIAEWWLEERLVPTGEFGGRVGDDTDLYQQFADLPLLEDGGVGARIRENGARLAELADSVHLRGGINLHATDALHAYEEGINHIALMARWNYGDPVYLERCMDSARNMEKLTVVTPDGRRHFRDYLSMGWRDVETPRKPALDGDAAPLMWHTALQVADYNRNPLALKLVGEWADSWLRFQKPGQWATMVETESGTVTASDPDRPLTGSWGIQAVPFVWLTALSGKAEYLDPFFRFYREGEAPYPSNGYLGDLWNRRMLDSLDEKTLDALAEHSPVLHLYRTGDPEPFLRTVIGNPRDRDAEISSLSSALRWPDMYTVTHQFTDRVFPSLLRHASTAYLGGYCLRNRFNVTQAASWEGFGTDYAALVTVNRPDRCIALVYNHASRPLRGTMRLWALEHGKYRITAGPDGDGDGRMDRAERTADREIARADAVALELPPRAVTVVEIVQMSRLDPLSGRADLALSPREIRTEGRRVYGVAHNIGSAEAKEVVVAAVDSRGREVARRSLGTLAAPLDLVPKRVPFTLELPRAAGNDWQVVLDPDGALPEIYEGNNVAALKSMPEKGR